MKIIAEIPARKGSERVKNKNLRLLDNIPMIGHMINKSLESKYLSDIYVNTDCDDIGQYAQERGVNFYKRNASLASNHATSDEYNYDFIKSINPDVLVQLNPVCPLINVDEIDKIIKFFIENTYDSLITVREERLQGFCNNKPINFNIDKKLPRTQDIKPIQICAWPVCIWDAKKFVSNFEKDGHSIFGGKLKLYPVSFLSSIKVSYEEDFLLAEKLLKSELLKTN